MKIICLLAAFFALMLAAYPSKPIPHLVAVSVTKPVILHRDKPVKMVTVNALAYLYGYDPATAYSLPFKGKRR